MESQGYDVNTATTSAFVIELLAIDGSDLHIATDPADTDTYFQSQPNTKDYNLLHLNAAYDLCNRLFLDAIVEPRRLCNEGRALAAMAPSNVEALIRKTFCRFDPFAQGRRIRAKSAGNQLLASSTE